MGAIAITRRVVAESPEKAFNMIRGDDTYEYGHDAYNGSFSTIDRYGEFKTYYKYSNSLKRKEEVNSFIQKAFDDCPKRAARYIDLGVVCYERTTFKEVRKKATAKYAQRYVLQKADYVNDWVDVRSADTKTELKKFCKEYLKKGFTCRIVKKPVLISGNSVASTFETKTERFTSRPKEINGTLSIKEMHEYVFCGWAAC